MSRSTVSSGVPDLDELLGGLIAGDNVVWAYDDVEPVVQLEAAFIFEGIRAGELCHYVTVTDAPSAVRDRLGAEVVVYDARPGKPDADLVRLEQRLVAVARESIGRFVIEGLDHFARRRGPAIALGFFSRVCPQLFDLGSIAYWRAPMSALGNPFLDDVRKVTQCVLQIERGNLRVAKAEGHRASAEGRLLRLQFDGDDLRLEAERSLGRLAAGLRGIRQQRHMTQAELARHAGVTPSAISQAEAGHRGLSLDTLVTLADQLQVSIDDLLARQPDADYLLARRDRAGSPGGITPLFDDPGPGLRAYLVLLAPGKTGVPPMLHKGAELVLVASGLVQLDLGSAMPVMRAGDAVLATRVPVAGWRNLLGEPARLFWILRD